MRLHHDEKVGITKRLTENIGAVLKTRLVEEEITIHTVTAPLVSYKPVNITKLKQDLTISQHVLIINKCITRLGGLVNE